MSLGLVITFLFAMSLSAVSAVTSPTPADSQVNIFLSGSPHYYGEPGPKDPAWYEEHKTTVGWIRTWNDGEILFVNIRITEGDALLDETHLAVASDFAGIPQTKNGNPKVGKFPYKHENLNGVEVDEFEIPLAALSVGSGDTVVIAVHAALSNGETAWANCGGPGAYFPGGNWATYFTYTIR